MDRAGFTQVVSADELALLDAFRECEDDERAAVLHHAMRCAGRASAPAAQALDPGECFLEACRARDQRIFDEVELRAARRAGREARQRLFRRGAGR
jgi:hypothetical protein